MTEHTEEDDLISEPASEQQEDLFEHHNLIADVGQEALRIDKFLMKRLPNVSRNRLQSIAKAGTLFVNGSTSKSKKSRYIPLHFILVTHLKSYLNYRKSMHSKCDALIISSKKDAALTDHGLKHWVTKYNRLSGVKFHIHQFRHTFACNLAKENANIISIRNVLGHASTRMTEHYLRSIKTENARLHINNLGY